MNCQSTSTTRISAFSPRYYLPYMTDTTDSIHWHWKTRGCKKGDACARLQEGLALQVQHLWWGRYYHLRIEYRFFIRTSSSSWISFVSPSPRCLNLCLTLLSTLLLRNQHMSLFFQNIGEISFCQLSFETLTRCLHAELWFPFLGTAI